MEWRDVYVGGSWKPVGCNVLLRKKTNGAIYIEWCLGFLQITCVAIILSYNLNWLAKISSPYIYCQEQRSYFYALKIAGVSDHTVRNYIQLRVAQFMSCQGSSETQSQRIGVFSIWKMWEATYWPILPNGEFFPFPVRQQFVSLHTLHHDLFRIGGPL